LSRKAIQGEGNPNANIMFIGEAPGRREEIEGRPFVGLAGRLLNMLLNGINLKRETVYITNVVKYRPPGNRNPNRREIKEDSKWLDNQIKSVKPELIVLLGRIALKRFFPDLNLSEDHGKKIERHIPKVGTFVFLSTYHPVSGKLATIKRDFENIRK